MKMITRVSCYTNNKDCYWYWSRSWFRSWSRSMSWCWSRSI